MSALFAFSRIINLSGNPPVHYPISCLSTSLFPKRYLTHKAGEVVLGRELASKLIIVLINTCSRCPITVSTSWVQKFICRVFGKGGKVSKASSVMESQESTLGRHTSHTPSRFFILLHFLYWVGGAHGAPSIYTNPLVSAGALAFCPTQL